MAAYATSADTAGGWGVEPLLAALDVDEPV